MTVDPNRFGARRTKSGLQPSKSGGDSDRNRLRPLSISNNGLYINNRFIYLMKIAYDFSSQPSGMRKELPGKPEFHLE